MFWPECGVVALDEELHCSDDCASETNNNFYPHELGELLAIVHRDGGHYIDKHGISKASFDARKIVSDLFNNKCHDNCVGKQQVVKMLNDERVKHKADMLSLLDEVNKRLNEAALLASPYITKKNIANVLDVMKSEISLTNNLTKGDEK
jgi:hypothetical protein